MGYEQKSKDELIQELKSLRQRVSELESRIPATNVPGRILQHSENHLNTLVNVFPGRVVLLSADGVYLDVIKHNHYDGNYQPDNVIGKSLHEVQTPEFTDFCMTKIRDVLESDMVHIFEYSFANTMGDYVYYEGHVAPLHDSETGEVNIVWVSRDITKRKKAESALRESENRLRTFANAMPDRAVIISEKGIYLDVIKRRQDVEAYQTREVIGKSLYDVQTREFADFCLVTIQKALETNELQVIEYDFVNQVGARVYYEGRINPLNTEPGEEPRVLWVSRDVTKRKENEQAVLRSEQRLRTFVDLLPDRAVIMDSSGDYIDVIKQRSHTIVDQPTNTHGKSIYDFAPVEFADFCVAKINEVLETNETQVIEYDVTTQGIQVFYEGRIAPWNVGDTDEKRILWISRDITDRKRMERALIEGEERLRTFVNLLPDRAVVINEEGRYVSLLKQHADTRLPQPDNVVGKTVYELFPKHFADFCMEKIREILEKDEMQTIEYDIFTKTGFQVFYEGRIAPWKMGDTDERRILWISRDITDRKEAQSALIESEARLRTFVDLLPDRAVVLDEEGRYVSLIKLAGSTTGGQLEDVVGHTLNEILPQEFADFCLAKIREVLEKDEIQVLEYDFMQGDTRVYYAGRIAPWKIGDDDAGRVAPRKIAGEEAKQVLWITRDITERKQAEMELARYRDHLETLVQERTAELEQEIAERKQLEATKIRQERLAAVGQLAAGIAHDFNNVMGVIMLDSSLVLRSPNLTEQERSKLDRVQKQAQHAANLIAQILDFSRRSVREPVILDLRILLSELIKFLQRTIPERIEVAFSYTKGDFPVNVDPTQFQQVITNLAVNARDAIEGNGKLSFRLEQFRLEKDVVAPVPEMTAGNWAHLDIVDTGQGIQPEHLSNIFEPFFTTKEVGKGTGLGLAQVHGIVHQHEGLITVRSEIGVGTTFSIYFPMAQGTAIPMEQNGEMKLDSGQGETILLVEDSPDLLEAISDLLESLDYNVLTATNGEDALAVYDANRQLIKLVLSDVVMPRMDGIELVRRLKRYFPKPKIIMMSGFHQNVTITPDIESAVIEWLQKPLDIEHLSEVLQQALPKSD